MKYFLFGILIFFSGINCENTEPPQGNGPVLKIQLQFDSNQPRLDNLGNPAVIPAGNAAQTPVFVL